MIESRHAGLARQHERLKLWIVKFCGGRRVSTAVGPTTGIQHATGFEGRCQMMHASPNQASAQGKPPALRAQVLALCAEVRYEGFGPTLMAEQLLQAKLVVDHEALRRWRLATSQHTVRRRKQKHRQWRERKPCFGEMV